MKKMTMVELANEVRQAKRSGKLVSALEMIEFQGVSPTEARRLLTLDDPSPDDYRSAMLASALTLIAISARSEGWSSIRIKAEVQIAVDLADAL